MAIEGLPLVTDRTRAQSENIETVVGRLRNERILIPDYQRDAEQWDERKESLFIESILNNLTIPAFFFSQIEDQKIEVVDGQQRLIISAARLSRSVQSRRNTTRCAQKRGFFTRKNRWRRRSTRENSIRISSRWLKKGRFLAHRSLARSEG